MIHFRYGVISTFLSFLDIGARNNIICDNMKEYIKYYIISLMLLDGQFKLQT